MNVKKKLTKNINNMKKSDYVGMLFLAAGIVVLCAETETVHGLIIKGLVSVGCIAVAAIIAIFQNINNYKS